MSVRTGEASPLTLSEGLVERVRSRLLASTAGAADVTAASVARALRAEGVVVGDGTLLAMVRALQDELLGAGPLEPWLRDPGVTDVLVNGPEDVWVDRGAGLERIDVRFVSAEAVRRLAVRLANSAGRRLDDASPFVDARLPDGTRLHAVLAPISAGSSLISLRVPAARRFTLDDLVARGAVDANGAECLRAIVHERLTFLISGGTGTGKTTVLGTLLGHVERCERVVIIEESAELDPDHPHTLRLEARPPNAEGAGAVPLRELVRQALRMRPDRIVVGEVRGAEVLDLLMALNTGHEGGCGTVHANSARDVPARLEALGRTGGLDGEAVRSLIASGLDVVVHLGRGRGRDRVRRVQSIAVVDGERVRDAVTMVDGISAPAAAFPLLGERLADLPWR